MAFFPLFKYLGVRNLPHTAQGLVQKFFIFSGLQNVFFMISSTFYVLFVLDNVGYEVFGLLLAISFVLQAVLDYPSGVLGDWLGQRWILAIAYITYGLSYLLLMVATTFEHLLLVYLLVAIAGSQLSGALQSWFDNNYKVCAEEVDPKREIYRVYLGKSNTILGLLGACIFVIGGLFATLIAREAVFLFQAIGMFVLTGLSIIFVKDFKGVVKPKKSMKNYFKLLGEGLHFSFSSRYMIFLIGSICVSSALWSIWGQMILLPMYYGYTGSDMGASLFRFAAWILVSVSAAKAGTWSKNLNTRKWLPLASLLSIISFFGLFMILFTVFPLVGTLNIYAIFFAVLFFFISLTIQNIGNFLMQRLFLDIIPDKNRNSIYSLLPTLSLLASAPIIFLAGRVIEALGLVNLLVLLMAAGILSSIFLFLSIRFLPQNILFEEDFEPVNVFQEIKLKFKKLSIRIVTLVPLSKLKSDERVLVHN